MAGNGVVTVAVAVAVALDRIGNHGPECVAPYKLPQYYTEYDTD
jgi:hypothetical protein